MKQRNQLKRGTINLNSLPFSHLSFNPVHTGHQFKISLKSIAIFCSIEKNSEVRNDILNG